ncbi:uncharacterized protein (TIGR02444 family) [Caulobacter ginsengisoli]|uniref:Uncharacterized protein (TIGR02444 family) n=1 Tax=Caulobacter ginsengisoli TaxID=400775 RepID=A0ABU0IT70_9CAUL|nr:TIGR02444 family protein [Caulobacter ginsengisoli]MDQ0465185.1 uncharacterized protein (TIGR02444 family) [Caulobacter ginsengisoli]
MALWDWTLKAYDRPGVAEACLKAQDGHGLNTSLLLWAAWADPDDAALAQAVEIGKAWETTVLWPLRHVRRDLKTAMPGVGDQARLDLREDVKAAELRSERVLMESFEALAGQAAGPVDLTLALNRAAQAWRNDAPPKIAIAELAAALA